MTAAIVGGVAGVVTGGITSLIAPWAQWGVDKRRLRRAERRNVIAAGRDCIRTHPDRSGLLLDGRYMELRSYLTPEEREAAEAPEQSGHDSAAIEARFDTLSAAIDRLEREWKLR